MTNVPINRVEAELSQWRSREERFGKLFSFNLSTNKALLKEKLKCYDRIAAKYKGTTDLDERFALKIMQQERNQINRQLYPNLLIRALRWLLVAPVKEQIIIRRDNRNLEQNSRLLHQQVQRAGFPDLSAQINERIRQGQQHFSIPLSYYLNDKEKIDHQLTFVKDPSGQYQFDGYKTTLYNESKPDERKQQYFSMRNGYNVGTTEAYNLLAGRCVQSGSNWMQLDFNDKDANGNFRIKQFHSDFGFDLHGALAKHPIKELEDDVSRSRLMQSLESGNRQSITFIKYGREQTYFVEADPQFKTLRFFDSNMQKVLKVQKRGEKERQDGAEEGLSQRHSRKISSSPDDGSDTGSIQNDSGIRRRRKSQSIS